MALTNPSKSTEEDKQKYYMSLALDSAKRAAQQGEVPVGAVVVYQDPDSQVEQVIGVAHNLRETHHDPCAHAEIIAMQQAAKQLGYWRLHECTLYVTLEPCIMCAGAIVNARVKHVVYGCDDPKAGAVRSIYSIISDQRLNHRSGFTAGVEAEQCANLLKDFFRARRQENKRKARRQKQSSYQILEKISESPKSKE